MGKVILSVEQNKALRQLKSLRWPKENILGQHIKGWVYPEHQCLKGLSFTELETVINVPDSYVVVNKSEELKEFEMATKPLDDMLDAFRYGAAMMIDKKIAESIMSEGDSGMDKVVAVLTKEQSEAIIDLKKRGWTKRHVLDQHIKGWIYPKHTCLNSLTYSELEAAYSKPRNCVVVAEEKEGDREPLQPTKAEVDQVAKNNEHLDHPFYKKVDEVTKEVALEQILKGAAKYDEPFNPGSWSGRQLTIHALQKLRDGQVYVVGMMEKFEEMESEIRKLTEIIDLHEKDKRDLLDAITNRDNEIERLKEGLANINTSYDTMWDERYELEDEIKRLKEQIDSRENGMNDILGNADKYNEQLKREKDEWRTIAMNRNKEICDLQLQIGDLHMDKMKLVEKIKVLTRKPITFNPEIVINLNGNIDPDFDGAKVAKQLAEQINKGLSGM